MIEVTIKISADDAPALLKEVEKLRPEMLMRYDPAEPQQSEEKTECSVDTAAIEKAWKSYERNLHMTEKYREIMQAVEDNNAKFNQPSCEEEEYAEAPAEETEAPLVISIDETPEVPAEESEPTETYTKEEVRALLAEARAKDIDIKALMKPFGGPPLNAVDPSQYGALMVRTRAALADKVVG